MQPALAILVMGLLPSTAAAQSSIANITYQSDAVVEYGDSFWITVRFNSPVLVSDCHSVSGPCLPRLRLTIGDKTRYAEISSGSSRDNYLKFVYTVQPDDLDTNGISIPANPIDLNGPAIVDLDSGVTLNLSYAGLSDESGPKVDGSKGEGLIYSALPTNSFSLQQTAALFSAQLAVGRTITPLTATPVNFPEGATFTYAVTNGTLPPGLSLNPSTGAITGTPTTVGGVTSVTITVTARTGMNPSTATRDIVFPPVYGPAQIANITYSVEPNRVVRRRLNIYVRFTPKVSVTGNPRLRLTIGDETRYAEYEDSPSNDNSLFFVYRVHPDDLDTNGISIPANPIDLNGGTIKNLHPWNSPDSNVDANLSYAGLSDQSGPKVDGSKGGRSVGLRYSSEPNTLAVGTTITPLTATPLNFPEGATLTYEVSRGLPLPPGLTLNTSTGAITGTPTTVGNPTSVIITVTAGTGRNLLTASRRIYFPRVHDLATQAIESIFVPSSGTYEYGNSLGIYVQFTSPVSVAGNPRLRLMIGDETRYARLSYGGVYDSDNLEFYYTIQPDDLDTNGISIPANPIDLNGGTIKNRDSGVDANLSYPGLSDKSGAKVDGSKGVGLSYSSVPSPLAVGRTITPLMATPVNFPEGATFTYAVDDNYETLPPGLRLNTSTGAITGTPTTVGSWWGVGITVTAGTGMNRLTASEEIGFAVIGAPVFDPTALMVNEGSSATYTVKLGSQPSASVTVAVIEAASGEVTVNPTSLTFTSTTWNTAQTVTVTAGQDTDVTDDSVILRHSVIGGGSHEDSGRYDFSDYGYFLLLEEFDSVAVTVDDDDIPNTAPNTAPSITDITNKTATVGKNLLVDVDATDADAGDTLEYKAVSGDETVARVTPTTLSAHDANSQVTVTPVGEGTATITVTVNDGTVDATDTFVVTVVKGKLATPTNLALKPNSNTRTGFTVTWDAVANAAGYTATAVQGSNSSTGTVSTPSTGPEATFVNLTANTTYTVTVTATGDANYLTSDASDFDVTTAANQVPIVATAIPDQTATVDTAFEYIFPAGTFSDGDSDSLTYTATRSDNSALPTWLAFTASERKLAGTPQSSDTGTLMVKVTASDGMGGSVSDIFDIDVSTAADAPFSVTGPKTIGEDAGTATYTVRLSAQPSATVTVSYATADGTATAGSDYMAARGTLTFTPANWQTEQTVDVTITDDTVDDDDETFTFTFTLSNPGSGAVLPASRSLSITITDDDVPVLTVSFAAATYSVTEGATVSVAVSLSAIPERSVTIPLTATNGTGATSSDYSIPSSITFASTETSKTLTFSATDDAVDEDNETVTLGFGTLPPRLTAGTTSQTAVTIMDDDSRGLMLSATSLAVNENAFGTYTVALSSQPTTNVTVTVDGATGDVSMDTDPATTGDQTTLTFTPTNWSTARMVTVTAADDDDAVNDPAVTLTHTASGGDYASLTGPSLSVTITENDSRGVTLSTTNLTVNEEDMESYTVLLDSEPTENVTVTIGGTDNTDITVDTDPATTGDQTTLTFTPTNWSTAQVVTVAAADDDDSVTDTAVTLTHTASGGDYASLTGPSLSVTIIENDAASFDEVNTEILPSIINQVAENQVAIITSRSEIISSGLNRVNLSMEEMVTDVADYLFSHHQEIQANDFDWRQALSGKNFSFTLAETSAPQSSMDDGKLSSSGSGPLSFWGAIDYSSLQDKIETISLDGDTLSFNFGVDKEFTSDLVLGVLLSIANSEFDLTGGFTGTYEVDLSTLNPYISWEASEDLSLWASVGYGRGQVDLTDDSTNPPVSERSDFTRFSAGGRFQLWQSETGTGLALKLDGTTAHFLGADVQRSRLATELSHDFSIESGVLNTALELGLLMSSADESAAELVGRLHWRSNSGLSSSIQSRVLLGGGDRQEWGIGGALRYTAGGGEGLMMSLEPSFGISNPQLLPDLWQVTTSNPATTTAAPTARLNAKLAYGFPRGAGLLTPYTKLSFSAHANSYGAGLRYGLEPGLEVEVEGRHHRQATGNSDNRFLLQLRSDL